MKKKITKEELYDLYCNKGLSTYRLSDIYGVSPETIRYYLIKYGIPRRSRPEPVKPKLDPSPELAYVLGVLYGDGTVSKCKSYNKKLNKVVYRYVIQLAVVDKIFAKEFMQTLKRLGLHPKMYISRRSKKEKMKGCRDRWLVVAISKKFYEWFKSLTLEDVEKIVNGYEAFFLKGFYESEGSINKPSKQMRIRMLNTNKELIMLVYRMLLKLGFKPSIYIQRPPNPRHKTGYAIAIYGDSEVMRFLRLTKPCIKNILNKRG